MFCFLHIAYTTLTNTRGCCISTLSYDHISNISISYHQYCYKASGSLSVALSQQVCNQDSMCKGYWSWRSGPNYQLYMATAKVTCPSGWKVGTHYIGRTGTIIPNTKCTTDINSSPCTVKQPRK